MDRISALRNIEDALSAFEAGESTLAELEGDVRGILRTYATELDGEVAAFRATGGSADGLVVVAESRAGARERIDDLVSTPGSFGVEPLE